MESNDKIDAQVRIVPPAAPSLATGSKEQYPNRQLADRGLRLNEFGLFSK